MGVFLPRHTSSTEPWWAPGARLRTPTTAPDPRVGRARLPPHPPPLERSPLTSWAAPPPRDFEFKKYVTMLWMRGEW